MRGDHNETPLDLIRAGDNEGTKKVFEHAKIRSSIGDGQALH